MNGKFTTYLMMLLALCLLLLSGCSTVAAWIPRDRAPADLRQPCPPPDLLPEDRPVLMGDLVQADSDLAFQYRECAKRVDGWIRWEAGVK